MSPRGQTWMPSCKALFAERPKVDIPLTNSIHSVSSFRFFNEVGFRRHFMCRITRGVICRPEHVALGTERGQDACSQYTLLGRAAPRAKII